MILDSDFVRNLIAAFTLCVSLLALVFSRRDSQKSALDRIETNLGAKIKALEMLGNERHEAVGGRLGNIDTKLAAIEESMRHVPTSRDIDTLQNLISSVNASVAELKGSLDRTNTTVDRINQFLMENGR